MISKACFIKGLVLFSFFGKKMNAQSTYLCCCSWVLLWWFRAVLEEVAEERENKPVSQPDTFAAGWNLAGVFQACLFG